MSVYGIFDPLIMISPFMSFKERQERESIQANQGYTLESSLIGTGALLGAGFSYKFDKTASFLAELHLGIPYETDFSVKLRPAHSPKDSDPIVQSKASYEFSPYIRVFVGMSFHSKSVNTR